MEGKRGGSAAGAARERAHEADQLFERKMTSTSTLSFFSSSSSSSSSLSSLNFFFSLLHISCLIANKYFSEDVF